MAALRWSDVDLKNGRITVSRSRIRVGNTEIEKEPKSESGLRTVALPKTLIDMLQDRVSKPDAYVLTTSHGQRVSLGYLTSAIKEAMKAIGCDDGYCLHSTRHTHATHLLNAKMPIKAVSKRLGHSDISTTMRIYAKVLDQDDADLASAIDRVIA
jgi:integrase